MAQTLITPTAPAVRPHPVVVCGPCATALCINDGAAYAGPANTHWSAREQVCERCSGEFVGGRHIVTPAVTS